MIDPADRKLTTKNKKQITKDWQEFYPNFSIYKPMQFLRRVGPIMIGICLERDSSNDKYRPCFHIHNLIMPFDVITLTLRNQLKSKAGGPDWVTVRSHNETYKDAIRRFPRSCLLPMEGDVTLKQVLKAYEADMAKPPLTTIFPMQYADMALLCAWADEEKKALSYIERGLKGMQGYDIPFINHHHGGIKEWGIDMRQKISDRQRLCSIVEQEIIKHKLSDIHESKLIIS